MLRRFTFEETHLGTPIVLQLVADCSELEAGAWAKPAFNETQRIEHAYSRFRENNVLSALNASVGMWFPITEELYSLLAFGARLRERTQGAFDLSVKGILESWGYDARYSFEEGARTEMGSFELRRMGPGYEVNLSAPIELGGLGKGYAIDRMANVLNGVTGLHGFCINAGGDLFVKGEDENGLAWKIVFEHPQDITVGIGEVCLNESTMGARGMALASSSPSRRHWKNGDRARHHLVDPRTGEPADKMLAVYVQASDALVADAYSTALFVLGFEEAKSLIPQLPLEAMLISPQGKIWRSEAFLGELYT